jgi:protein-tyrosine phosphatase
MIAGSEIMWTTLHWVAGPWVGRLAIAARPRGGEWLDDEMANWRQNGVHTIVSLLTPEEDRDLDLAQERERARVNGLRFLSLPIADRQVPQSDAQVAALTGNMIADLEAGRNVVIHCRQGIGRAGLIAASVLLDSGVDLRTALNRLSAARGIPVPETPEQSGWLDHYAGLLTGSR